MDLPFSRTTLSGQYVPWQHQDIILFPRDKNNCYILWRKCWKLDAAKINKKHLCRDCLTMLRVHTAWYILCNGSGHYAPYQTRLFFKTSEYFTIIVLYTERRKAKRVVNFFGPKMALAVARAIQGAENVLAPSKSLDFHGDPLEMALVMAFPARKWLYPAQYKVAVN